MLFLEQGRRDVDPGDAVPLLGHLVLGSVVVLVVGVVGVDGGRRRVELVLDEAAGALPGYESPILQNGCRTRIRYGPIRRYAPIRPDTRIGKYRKIMI